MPVSCTGLDAFDAMTRALVTLETNAICYAIDDLPKLTDVPVAKVYPKVARKLLDDRLTPKFSLIVLVGPPCVKGTLLRNHFKNQNRKIAFELCEDFTSEGFEDLSSRMKKYPSDSLFIFLLDLFSLTTNAVYENCAYCSRKLTSHTRKGNIFEDNYAMTLWAKAKCACILQSVERIKALLPCQAKLAFGPAIPSLACLVDENSRGLDHERLHIQEAITIFGNIEKKNKWIRLYQILTKEINSSFGKSSDPVIKYILSNVKETGLVFTASPNSLPLEYTANSRTWCRELISATSKIAEIRHKPDEYEAGGNLHQYIEHSLEQQALGSNHDVGLAEASNNGSPCTIFVGANVSLPFKLVDRIATIFCANSTNKGFSHWLLHFESEAKASLCVAVLNNFRLSLLVFIAHFNDETNLQCPPSNVKRVMFYKNVLFREFHNLSQIVDGHFLNPKDARDNDDNEWEYCEGLQTTMLYVVREMEREEITAPKEVRVIVVTATEESAANLELNLKETMKRSLPVLDIVSEESAKIEGEQHRCVVL